MILFMQLLTVTTMLVNNVNEVDAVVKTKIKRLINLEYIGMVQSVSIRQIGPLTFFKYKFFAQDEQQVSAKATQFLGFNPQFTCVSSSKKHLCQ